MLNRKNIYNQINNFLDFIKSSEGVSLFTKNSKYVKFKNLTSEGENIKIIDSEDTITIKSETPSSITNNSYRKILISGIINDTFGKVFLKISTESNEFSLRITGYSYQGHSSHCFVSNDNISFIGVKYMEPEFKIVGDASYCEISFDKIPQLFTYCIEIISKTSIYVYQTQYKLSYIS